MYEIAAVATGLDSSITALLLLLLSLYVVPRATSDLLRVRDPLRVGVYLVVLLLGLLALGLSVAPRTAWTTVPTGGPDQAPAADVTRAVSQGPGGGA